MNVYLWFVTAMLIFLFLFFLFRLFWKAAKMGLISKILHIFLILILGLVLYFFFTRVLMVIEVPGGAAGISA